MASISVPCPKISSLAPVQGSLQGPCLPQNQRVSFPQSSNPRPFGSSSHIGFQLPKEKQPSVWKAHARLNKVATEESSDSAQVLDAKSKAASSDEEDGKVIPDAASIVAFMTQVSDIVKLVDSRDIVELQLKQQDCEVIIRKKEALQQPAPAAPVLPPMFSHTMVSSPPPAAPVVAPAAAPASPPPSAPAPALPAPAKTSTSSHPSVKCPMAGTFYKCPAPGEPPFVKVGDKVQKGQVICIIEAMKLMNEIEADRSGTIVEILVEDGKPVSVDTPLVVIAP
ncbi:biotin carboxyl carrier protein of acetyl-CoA carboxylase 2 chloroplastic [Tripterygium wilfordii]|uniref:Biotin carboxyl carrier protein of acetyl-CoA carboxylase n=1 Tax=Tripterygium wilfordii TaxID=458696 RepID=A0A7J7CNE1_TRIWF|nr:biotin carboxyl carrier protein of acetyl-CoA carboxylase 2, chloroplastic [Tripterygium wilfordii]KAF5735590.1 biotin carboxyl carrier protein of acetyl-CoA carboxylase 2 chloroplastic [Tripterygium wilfordii]